jgi:hypothetical protein
VYRLDSTLPLRATKQRALQASPDAAAAVVACALVEGVLGWTSTSAPPPTGLWTYWTQHTWQAWEGQKGVQGIDSSKQQRSSARLARCSCIAGPPPPPPQQQHLQLMLGAHVMWRKGTPQPHGPDMCSPQVCSCVLELTLRCNPQALPPIPCQHQLSTLPFGLPACAYAGVQLSLLLLFAPLYPSLLLLWAPSFTRCNPTASARPCCCCSMQPHCCMQLLPFWWISL